ncbi:c-type cytochrome [Hyphomicrobium sp.]|uniref:c-type cytochrome n=1 Tax=Hyphomicrobium sp. TaxID=82 RepID=UPI002E327D5F|nr:c-type cytochrome [Hyphomicrobium sp.]HEX2842097.1 c-type cytochrome [Hyphomicrobium sp.]
MTSRRTKPAGGLSAAPANVGSIAPTLHSWIGKVATILVLAIAILTAQTRIAPAGSDAWTTIIREGAEEYKESCAACHGTNAQGRGDLGQKLFKKPNDLTEIPKRNNGAFPFRRVFDIIAGDQPVDGHDTMHMPKYAERMKGEDFQPGYNRAHLRILELAHYLESIQAAQQTPQR